MKKQIITLLLAASLACSFTACGSKQEEISSSSGIITELTSAEEHDVISSLMGTVRHFEPDLELPDTNREYTIAKVEGHYNLAGTAKRPDGSNAMISYWVDLDGDDYYVHYFSVKDDVYVDDKEIDAIFEKDEE